MLSKEELDKKIKDLYSIGWEATEQFIWTKNQSHWNLENVTEQRRTINQIIIELEYLELEYNTRFDEEPEPEPEPEYTFEYDDYELEHPIHIGTRR